MWGKKKKKEEKSKKHRNDPPKVKFTGNLTYYSDTEIIEEFRTIKYKDYGDITVNNLGTKIKLKSGKAPAIWINEGGYLEFGVGTTENKVNKHRHVVRIHRLVALAFLDNPNNLPEVNHKDLNKFNNCVTNLEWISTLDNNRHARANGKMKGLKGSKNGRSKLTEERVREIKQRYESSEEKYGLIATMAKEYNVSWSLIKYIISGKNWKHVK